MNNDRIMLAIERAAELLRKYGIDEQIAAADELNRVLDVVHEKLQSDTLPR